MIFVSHHDFRVRLLFALNRLIVNVRGHNSSRAPISTLNTRTIVHQTLHPYYPCCF
jgi:hypothetical protein